MKRTVFTGGSVVAGRERSKPVTPKRLAYRFYNSMADAVDATPPSPLTNARLMRLSGGLASLDGIRPKPGEFKPFDFSAETTFKIAANAALVADKAAPFNRAKELLAVKYEIAEGMKVTAANAKNVSDFMEALGLLEDKEVTVDGLEKISLAELNIGFDCKKNQNQIAASTLAALMPILEA